MFKFFIILSFCPFTLLLFNIFPLFYICHFKLFQSSQQSVFNLYLRSVVQGSVTMKFYFNFGHFDFGGYFCWHFILMVITSPILLLPIQTFKANSFWRSKYLLKQIIYQIQLYLTRVLHFDAFSSGQIMVGDISRGWFCQFSLLQVEFSYALYQINPTWRYFSGCDPIDFSDWVLQVKAT